ncbi:MAG: hypothetical protein HQL11_05880 [Candidatus Omnitrophica bacterium]|nr:hypothetical protein [Candidatus Omnitrophota bacterium]
MITANLLPEEFRHKPPAKFELPGFASPKGLLFFLVFLFAAEIGLVMIAKNVFVPRTDRMQE